MHVHDFSGLIHIEGFTAPPGGFRGTLYTLGDFLGLWGVPVDQLNGVVGPFMGNRPLTIYTSGPVARGGPGTGGFLGSSTYTLFTGDMNSIPLYSHEAIWILIGTGNPTGNKLPNVDFFTEY